ncbi:O-antigen ligase [Sellimonas catena]|uniref:O-antigen ligase family protein n=1 Tax=Sellimonas catena TaxID=2994035 RepID=UPI00248F4936|nr:O-antigen ligase family protein [Sellimonas catena]
MLKTKRSEIGWFILFSGMFLPYCITTTFSYFWPRIYQYARYLRILICFGTVLLSIFLLKKIKRQLIFILIVFVYLGILLYSTKVHNVDLSFYINYAVTIIFMVFFFELAVHRFLTEILNVVWFWCFILTLINLFTIIRYPNGFYIRYDVLSSGAGMPYWFLGNRNLYVDFLLPMMISAILLEFFKGKGQIKFYISILISILTVVFTGSATTILIICIIGFYWSYLKKRNCPKWFDGLYILIAYSIISIMIIGMRQANIFSFIIVNVLNKDITLSSRTSVWQDVLERIPGSPWIGYGYRSGTNFLPDREVMHAHNLFLHILYSGGILAFIALCILIVMCAYVLRKYKKYRLSSIMTTIFLTYLWMEFSEPRIYFPFLFAALTLIWNMPTLEKQIVNKKGKIIKIRWKKNGKQFKNRKIN